MNKAIIAVESSQNFYELITMHLMQFKSKSPFLESFYSHFHAAINGCSCKKNYNLSEATKIYEQNIKDLEPSLKEEMKNILNAQNILFFKDQKILLFQF
jgi:hypothetical protein